MLGELGFDAAEHLAFSGKAGTTLHRKAGGDQVSSDKAGRRIGREGSAWLRLLADEAHQFLRPHGRFTELNTAYVEKFGFPFIIAVKGLNKDDILAAFEKRIDNTRDEEFETATAQVERIAFLRLEMILPGR